MTRSSGLATCCYSIEPRTRNDVKEFEFLSFGRNVFKKYGRQLLDAATKTVLIAWKTAAKKVAHKAAEATEEFIVNKIADKVVKPKPMPEENLINIEEIIIPPDQREEILGDLRHIIKWNSIKYMFLIDSIFCDRKINRSKWFIRWSISCQQEC